MTFWAAIHRKTEEIHTKLRKIADSQFEIGPQKFLFGPHVARGPRVGHPCFKGQAANPNSFIRTQKKTNLTDDKFPIKSKEALKF